MTVRQYIAQWYESDEYEQWLQQAAFDDLDTAKQTAFKNVMKCFTHAICYVDIQELGEYGFETTQELINHHDSGNKWSGWITKEKYDRLHN